MKVQAIKDDIQRLRSARIAIRKAKNLINHVEVISNVKTNINWDIENTETAIDNLIKHLDQKLPPFTP